MPRERLYDSNADRQAAYRARLAERHALAGTGQLIGRLTELEAALAAANRRADAAEQKTVRAERQAAAARDRYAELLAARPTGVARYRVDDRLAAALQRVAELEATVAELRQRLAVAEAARSPASAPSLNRAARRAAERDQRRRRN
jgi:GMP synthase PP-ATPase subunit